MVITGTELFLRVSWTDSKGKLRQDDYGVNRRDPGEAKLLWTLRKPDEPESKWRHITVHNDGRITCDCQSFILGRKLRCKHIEALMQRGLLPSKDKVWSKV